MLSSLDQSISLFLNGLNSPFLDKVMIFLTTQETWYILYALIIGYLAIRQRSGIILSVFLIALLITLADQTSSGFLKPTVKRLRPCHEPEIKEMVHAPNGCGGQYGFTSSHASNHFAIAFFLFPLFRQKFSWAWVLFPWAAVIAYSRVYLGVHYLGDVLVGGLIGAVYGYLLFKAGMLISKRTGLQFSL